ncbi:hypothetical protein [Stenomitos frigidus]|nr:hypothetical protein [Stenomitos frigidus]
MLHDPIVARWAIVAREHLTALNPSDGKNGDGMRKRAIALILLGLRQAILDRQVLGRLNPPPMAEGRSRVTSK